jgi:thiol-disulfide isomerase/thioredoxin
MRRGGAGLIAALLLLAGCKGTTPKPADKEPAGLGASRPKVKSPDWLEPTAGSPVAGTGIPKADSWADPKNPNFNIASEVKGVLAGRVIDSSGRGAKNVFIQIEPADAQPGSKGGAPVGISTDAAGYFMAKALKPGQAYNLTAKAEVEGKPLQGVVQVKTPNPTVIIVLRDDLPPPPAGGGAPAPPPAATGVPPGAPTPVAGEPLPPPGELLPPMGVPMPGTTGGVRPADGAWAPGTGAATGGIPPTIGAPPGGPPPGPPPLPALPPDPSAPAPKTPRPENIADGPSRPWTPPTVTIPGPPGSPFPPSLPLPPPASPAPPGGMPDPKKNLGVGRTVSNVGLVDSLDRPWSLASRSGSVVLLDFLTSTCVPCKKAIPTLVDLQARYGAAGLQVVGVLCDDLPQQQRATLAAKYQRENSLNYMVYAEPGESPGAVRDRFGVPSYPTVVLLDERGNVLWEGHPTYPASNRTALEAAIKRAVGK